MSPSAINNMVDFEIDFFVKRVLEFVQNDIPEFNRMDVIRAVGQLAPLIWDNPNPVKPVNVVYNDRAQAKGSTDHASFASTPVSCTNSTLALEQVEAAISADKVASECSGATIFERDVRAVASQVVAEQMAKFKAESTPTATHYHYGDAQKAFERMEAKEKQQAAFNWLKARS